VIFAAAFALAAANLHAGGFHANCEARLARTEISVDAETAPYVTISALGTDELTARNPSGAPSERTLGLTIAHYMSAVDFEQNGIRDPDTHEYCMRPHFRVRLSYAPIEVYVGREIQTGSCPYLEAVAHEEKHVAAYDAQLRKAAETMEREMRAYYRDTVFYGNSGELEAQLAYSVKHLWLPLAQKQLEAVEATQQAIDTPQEYARYRAACNGEVNRILNGMR
jgi:hypothetical protein